ncbi:MAG: hypothetical protein D6813_14735 [Calditrichaeota bacterium]|nr:MAG: hypothetical protein D6813_14735 [Calditrichota bacterium]
MAEEKRGKRDIWTKLQVLSTVLLGAVGLVFTVVHQNIQEENRKWQAATQILSSREISEMEFRQRMFDTVLNKLLNPVLSIQERVTILRLFQNNFHDVFNGRAFFDILADEARKEGNLELVKELYSIGKEIANIQESIIEANFRESDTVKYWVYRHAKKNDQGTGFPEIQLDEGDSVEVYIFTQERNAHGDTHKIKIILNKVESENAINVKLVIQPNHASTNHNHVESQEPINFAVSYFDVPFTDNTILPDGHRISIILKEVCYWNYKCPGVPKKAKLKIIEFPAHYIISGYRPSLNHVQNIFAELENKSKNKKSLWPF